MSTYTHAKVVNILREAEEESRGDLSHLSAVGIINEVTDARGISAEDPHYLMALGALVAAAGGEAMSTEGVAELPLSQALRLLTDGP